MIDHFGLNLRRMIHLAEEANVPLLLVNPVEDLRDSPPFKSAFDDRLLPEQLQQCRQLLDSATDDPSLRARQRLELLDQLLAIDPRRGDAIYLKARILEAEAAVPAAWRTRRTEDQHAAIIAKHLEMADTVLRRDAEAARRAMDEHFDRAIGAMLAVEDAA